MTGFCACMVEVACFRGCVCWFSYSIFNECKWESSIVWLVNKGDKSCIGNLNHCQTVCFYSQQ